eukprot:9621718-Ditylum_brightwellii.AAC.1
MFNKENPLKVMLIDMGATSYSVSIISFEPGKLIVKSSQHDPDLDGREFDKVIAEWIAEAFKTKYKGKLSGKPKVAHGNDKQHVEHSAAHNGPKAHIILSEGSEETCK